MIQSKKPTDTPRFENSREQEKVTRKSSKSQPKKKVTKKKASEDIIGVGTTTSKKIKKPSETTIKNKINTSSNSKRVQSINTQINISKNGSFLKGLYTNQTSMGSHSPSPINQKRLSTKKSPEKSPNYSLVSMQSPQSKKLNKSKTESSIIKKKDKQFLNESTQKRVLNTSRPHSKKASMQNTQEDKFMTSSSPKEQTSRRYNTENTNKPVENDQVIGDRLSSSSSSDNEFDVILSPRVVGRLQVQSQIAQDAINQNKESDLVIQKKIDDWKRERLEKEFKCLFYKTREIAEILLNSQKANSQLQKDLDEKQKIYELTKQKYKQCKLLLKEIKSSLIVKDQATVEISNKESLLQNEVEDLNKTVKDYKLKLKNIEFEYQKLQQESSSEKNSFADKMKLLKEQLNNKQVEELKKSQNLEKLENATQMKIEYLQNQNQNQLEKLNQQQDKYNQDVRDMKEEIIELERKYQSEIKEMQYKEHQSFEMFTTLERERDKFAAQVEQLISTNTKYQHEVTDMQRVLKDDKEDYYKYKEENQILQLKNENCQEQIEELKRKNESQKKKVNELEDQLFKLKNDKFEEKIQHENTLTVQQNQSMSLQSLKKELEQEKYTKDQQQLDLVRYKELNNGLERENKLLKDDLNTKNLEIDRIRESKDRIDEQLRRELDDIKTQKREQEMKLKKKDIKLSKLRDEMDSKIRRLNEKNLKLENELVLEKRHIDDKFTSIHDLQKNYEQQVIQNKVLQQEKQGVEEMMKQVELDTKIKLEQSSHLQIRIQDLEKQVDTLEQEKETYKNKFMFTKYETRKLKDEFYDKENRLRSVYDSQIEQFNFERDQFLKQKIEEDSLKKSKDCKMRVLGDIKEMIRHHKDKVKDGKPY